MPYEVINLDTEESHGVYETLEEARGCVQFDKLHAYSIWRGRWATYNRLAPCDQREFESEVRVENCEPYDGDDNRARQGLGEGDR
jgi:hypothetical protein